MVTGRFNRTWIIIMFILIAVIAVGAVLIWIKYQPAQLIQITLPSPVEQQGGIYLSGAVSNPGFYPFGTGDSLGALIQAAGGTMARADLDKVRLYVPEAGEEQGPQKVDINRAEARLLEALPGIGETFAQRIVDYRQQNGPFRNTHDLLNVSGIGEATYEHIKDLITVSE